MTNALEKRVKRIAEHKGFRLDSHLAAMRPIMAQSFLSAQPSYFSKDRLEH